MEYTVNFTWNDETDVWIAQSDDIQGLVLEGGSLDALIERVRFAAPELLELNREKPPLSPSLCFRVERHGKGDHDIYYDKSQFHRGFKDKIAPYSECNYEASRNRLLFLAHSANDERSEFATLTLDVSAGAMPDATSAFPQHDILDTDEHRFSQIYTVGLLFTPLSVFICVYLCLKLISMS